MTKLARKKAALRRLSADLERQLAEDKLTVGEDWYLVSSAWWMRVLGTLNSEENEDQTDDDSEDSDDAFPRGNREYQVKNAVLLDLELSSRVRNVTVLKNMLVEGYDYRLVSQRVWNQLSDYFGFDWEIARPVVARGPAKNRVVEVHPFAFEILVWHMGLEKPIEILDPDQKKLIVTASEKCSIKELQVQICQTAALVPQLREKFPNLLEDMTNLTVQMCYRINENAPWTPLNDAVVQKDERTSSGFTRPDSVVESSTIEELHLEHKEYKPGKEKLHQLLVEGRFTMEENQCDGNWKHGKFYSDIQADGWRFALQKGQLIDALDTDNKWYESRVVDVDFDRLKVHYRGWSDKWDEWIPRKSTRIAPLHTKVCNWRNFQLGDHVLVGKNVLGKVYPEWRVARVHDRVESEPDGSLRVELDVDGVKQWIDAQDELLCPVGTHKPVNVAVPVSKPRGSSMAPVSAYSSRYDGTYDVGRGRPEYEGVVGLTNLGNTCFMNSMLQCLINTGPLRAYFLDKDPGTGTLLFTNEINRENPLGMKGMMAVAFASLLRKMWSNEFNVVTPTKLKSVIGQYAPQFAGYQQQDSQEFMSFLLDGLHEDLNRVKVKPYTKPVERKGRSDVQVAHEEWRQFMRRNDSIIVDNFMGQLRSHVTCSNPECENESITFDPFMSLSVPIPTKEMVTIEVQVCWANGEIPMKYAMRLPKEGCCLVDAKKQLSELSRLPVSRLFLVEVWNHGILKVYSDKLSLDRVRDGLLHAYELEVPVTEYAFSSPRIRPLIEQRKVSVEGVADKHMQLVELLHQAPVASPVDGRMNAVNEYGNLSGDGYEFKARRVEVELFNTPLLVSIGQKWTKMEIHHKVWQIVHRLVAIKKVGKEFGCEKDQELPYRLHVVDFKTGTILENDLPRNDDPMDLPDSLRTPFRFILEWNRNGYQRGYDETSAKRIELHESIEKLKISPKPDRLTLLHCLNKFTEREQLGEADTWYCPKCKTHVRAFKKFDLFSLPKVLIFHLKRFRYAQNSFYLHRDKISTLVEFPIEGLDLSQFVIGPQNEAIYDLYAVSEHLGGLGGGHYTAVAKNPVNKRWFSFNDSHTSRTSAQDAVSSQAYVLFYIRRELS